jgi:(E)-4-hydroxy-3-methylbut-2-enyl-diphosphate synthase
MSIRPYRDIVRRKSRQVMVGSVPVGGEAPITVQTMTNTLTADADATIEQIRAAKEAGVDIIRVSCPDEESTKALHKIVKASRVPIVADIHFHYKRAIEAADAGAACLRINPGNIGSAERVREVVKAARDHGVSMRIGVNAGSLEKDLLEKYGEPCPEAMVESALDHARILQDHDFHEFKISVKASDVFLAVAAYQQLADACDYPLHVGVTEAGGTRTGTVKSSIGMGSLLWAGIGDTIRVSLSAEPEEGGASRLRDAEGAQPAPSRREHHLLPVLRPPAIRRDPHRRGLEKRVAHITTPMTVSVIGCVVNGPGRGARDRHRLHRRRQQHAPGLYRRRTASRLKDASVVDHLVELIEKKAAEIEASDISSPRNSGFRPSLPDLSSRRFPVSKMQPVRGTHDLLPDEYRRFAHVIDTRATWRASMAIVRWRRRSSSSPSCSRVASARRPMWSPRRCTRSRTAAANR